MICNQNRQQIWAKKKRFPSLTIKDCKKFAQQFKIFIFVCKIVKPKWFLPWKMYYRKRLLISACFFHTCTSHKNEVHAWKNHALISKRLKGKTILTYRYISWTACARRFECLLNASTQRTLAQFCFLLKSIEKNQN